MTGKCFLAGFALLWCTVSVAETAYVTDILRLGLHRAEDTSDSAFRTLVSGAELEVIERVPNYAQVRTVDGQTGWVKSAYLVGDKPAQLRVAEIEAELDGMRASVSDAQAAQLEAERAAGKLVDETRSRTDSSEEITATLERLKQENSGYRETIETYRGSLPISWVAAALVVVLIGGFLGGIAWIDYLSRRRHGGFRIY